MSFQQSQPQQQQHQVHYQPVRQALPSTTSASSSTRLFTPGPNIYDISAIDTEDISEGEQSPGIGNNHHLFNISQLNREHLRDLPRGLLHRWGILCGAGAVTSVAPRNVDDHVPLESHYTPLALSTANSNQSTYSHLWLQRHLASSCFNLLVCNNISFPVRFYICDIKAPLLGLHDVFDSEVILHINGKDCSVPPSNIKARQNVYTIIAATSSLTL